jgi:hypothetical protein
MTKEVEAAPARQQQKDEGDDDDKCDKALTKFVSMN